jgi:hypothetical protein
LGGIAGRRPHPGVRRRNIDRDGKQADGGKRQRQSEKRSLAFQGTCKWHRVWPLPPVSQVCNKGCLKNMHLRLLDNAGVRCIVDRHRRFSTGRRRKKNSFVLSN